MGGGDGAAVGAGVAVGDGVAVGGTVGVGGGVAVGGIVGLGGGEGVGASSGMAVGSGVVYGWGVGLGRTSGVGVWTSAVGAAAGVVTAGEGEVAAKVAVVSELSPKIGGTVAPTLAAGGVGGASACELAGSGWVQARPPKRTQKRRDRKMRVTLPATSLVRPPQPWVPNVAQGVAEEVEGHHNRRNRDARPEAQQRLDDHELASLPREHPAPRRRGRRHAQA